MNTKNSNFKPYSQNQDYQFKPFDNLFDDQNNKSQIQIGSLTFDFSRLTKKQKVELYKDQLFQQICLEDFSFDLISISDYKLLKQARDHRIILNFYKKQQDKMVKRKRMILGLQGNILNQVTHINFPNLSRLQISNQKLNNIQSFGFLNCPNLKFLQIDNCLIVSVKPLAKSSFYLLQTLLIQYNKEHSLTDLTRGNFSNLTDCDKFDYSNYPGSNFERENKISIKNFSFMLKMKHKQSDSRHFGGFQKKFLCYKRKIDFLKSSFKTQKPK